MRIGHKYLIVVRNILWFKKNTHTFGDFSYISTYFNCLCTIGNYVQNIQRTKERHCTNVYSTNINNLNTTAVLYNTRYVL